MKRITIYDGQRDRNKADALEAAVHDNGDLVFESYLFGDMDQTFRVADDREYWIIIKAENVSKVRRLLIDERFENIATFEEWLKELTAKLGDLEGSQDPMILLWLIKERFEDEHKINQWLRKKKIPYEIRHWG